MKRRKDHPALPALFCKDIGQRLYQEPINMFLDREKDEKQHDDSDDGLK